MTVRLGIIGARGQGAFYAGLIRSGQVPHMTLGALSGRSPETEAAAKERFGDVPYFTDPVAMMESGTVDAVVTTVPHYAHAEVAMAAMARGLHVLVEKPLGVYTKQVRRMLEMAEQTPSVVVGAMFNQRANPLFARLKQVIANGEIGDLRRGTWVITNWFRLQRYFDSAPLRGTWGGEGGGVLVNQAAHQIDLWQWLCGTPRSVYAKAPFGFAHDIAVDDDVTAVFNYGRHGTGVFIAATHDMMGSDHLEILGDQGRIVVRDSSTAQITRLHKPMREYSTTMDAATIERIVRGTIDWGEFSTSEMVAGTSVYGDDHARVLENLRGGQSDERIDHRIGPASAVPAARAPVLRRDAPGTTGPRHPRLRAVARQPAEGLPLERPCRPGGLHPRTPPGQRAAAAVGLPHSRGPGHDSRRPVPHRPARPPEPGLRHRPRSRVRQRPQQRRRHGLRAVVPSV